MEGDERPATWNKQIQAAIASVRKALGPTAIATTAVGYHLHLDPEKVDARRVEALVVGPGPVVIETVRAATGARSSTDAVLVDQFEEVLESGDRVGAEVAPLLAEFVRDGGKAIMTVRSGSAASRGATSPPPIRTRTSPVSTTIARRARSRPADASRPRQHGGR